MIRTIDCSISREDSPINLMTPHSMPRRLLFLTKTSKNASEKR